MTDTTVLRYKMTTVTKPLVLLLLTLIYHSNLSRALSVARFSTLAVKSSFAKHNLWLGLGNSRKKCYKKTSNQFLTKLAVTTMYFDDISRNSLKWEIPGTEPGNSGVVWIEDAKSKGVNIQEGTDQTDIVRRKEDYYKKVRKEVDSWARNTEGLLYNPNNKDSTVTTALYQNVLGKTIVCDSSTVLGCVAQFWNQAMKSFIKKDYRSQRKFSRHRWMMIPDVVFVQWIAFPNFLPHNLISLESILNFAKNKEHTVYLAGNQFSLRFFHPQQQQLCPKTSINFNNQTASMSSTVSSFSPPFPVLALQFQPSPPHIENKKRFALNYNKTAISDIVTKSDSTGKFFKNDKDDTDKDDDIEDELLTSIVNYPLHNLHIKQSSFEKLYNSEAASDIDAGTAIITESTHTVKPTSNDGDIDQSNVSILRKYFEKYHHEAYDEYRQTSLKGSRNSEKRPSIKNFCNYFDEQENDIKEESSVTLVRNFELEYRLRTRAFSKDEIRTMSLAWIEEQVQNSKNPLFSSWCTSNERNLEQVSSGSPTVQTTTSNNFWFGNLIHRKSSEAIENMVEESGRITTYKESDDEIPASNDHHSFTSSNRMTWFISPHDDGENVYADIWSVLDKLHAKIISEFESKQNEKPYKRGFVVTTANNRKQARLSTAKEVNERKLQPLQASSSALPIETSGTKDLDDAYSKLYSWMNKIVKPVVVDENYSGKYRSGANPTIESESMLDDDSLGVFSAVTGSSESNNVMGRRRDYDGSLMLVANNLYPFNAEAFKRFAITVHLSLQRALKVMNQQIGENQSRKTTHFGNNPDKTVNHPQQQHSKPLPRVDYHLEVFHPEYVGSKKGYNHSIRRSPFPMIQICYKVVTD